MTMKFNYNSHWRSWSRVLSFTPSTNEFIEINLSHINGKWDRASQEWVRIHRMARSPADIQSDSLPLIIVSAMRYKLGDALTNKLLTYDYLSNIDLARNYDTLFNTGLPFASIKS